MRCMSDGSSKLHGIVHGIVACRGNSVAYVGTFGALRLLHGTLRGLPRLSQPIYI